MTDENLRVLVVAYHFPPMNSAGAQRPGRMAKLLPDFGIDVSVLTHSHSRSDLLSEPGVLRVYDTNGRGAGKLLHYPLRILQRLSRAVGMSTSWHGVWSRAVRRRGDEIVEVSKPDVVLATYPPIETLEIGLHLSRKIDVPLVADFRDGLLFEPVEPQMLRSKNTRARYRSIEQQIARRAAAIITVSDPISDYFRRQYNCAAVRTIPNGFDPDATWIEPGDKELDRTKFNLVYTGRLGFSEKGRQASAFIEGVTRAVERSQEVNDQLRIHFVGDFSASEKSALSALIARGTVRIHAFVDRPRALGFQRCATMLLLVATSGKTSVATSKLFEYLTAGPPILGVTRKTAAERVLLETRAGFVVDPNDPHAIETLLTRLVLEPELRNSLKRNEGEIATYSSPNQMRVLADLLREVVTARTPAKLAGSR
jgi:glycosyltransferase involved in cell wall biosynthesis